MSFSLGSLLFVPPSCQSQPLNHHDVLSGAQTKEYHSISLLIAPLYQPRTLKYHALLRGAHTKNATQYSCNSVSLLIVALPYQPRPLNQHISRGP